MSTPCCACDKPDAGTLLRIVPRRDRDPLTPEMARATAWPSPAMPVDLPFCGAIACKQEIRAVARVVLAETVIVETQPTETTA